MANYSTLKAAVEAVVKTNGEQAITGANMQTVLLSIINSIGGGGYIFEGVATPSTNAGTPDQNVFYIAGAGTYANFGTSVIVPPTNIAVFKYNGSWTCEQVMVENGGVFDISAFKAVGGTLATYADLAAALGTGGANVPEGVRKGGMSVKFVCSSDNKYVQYMCKTSTWSSLPADWEKVNNVSVSQNTQTGHTDVKVGGVTTPVASIKDIDAVYEYFGIPETIECAGSSTLTQHVFNCDKGVAKITLNVGATAVNPAQTTGGFAITRNGTTIVDIKQSQVSSLTLPYETVIDCEVNDELIIYERINGTFDFAFVKESIITELTKSTLGEKKHLLFNYSSGAVHQQSFTYEKKGVVKITLDLGIHAKNPSGNDAGFSITVDGILILNVLQKNIASLGFPYTIEFLVGDNSSVVVYDRMIGTGSIEYLENSFLSDYLLAEIKNSVKFIDESKQPMYLGVTHSFNTSLSRESDSNLYWGIGCRGMAKFGKCSAGLTTSSATNAIRPITYENGQIIYENGYVFILSSSATTFCGSLVWRLNVNTYEMKLVGNIIYKCDGRYYNHYPTASCMYDRILHKWIFTLDYFSGDSYLYSASTIEDVRFGRHIVYASRIDMVNPSTSDEDSVIYYDDNVGSDYYGKYILMYVSNGTLKFQWSDTWNGTYTLINKTVANVTGQGLQKIGGVPYIFMGNRGSSNTEFVVYSYLGNQSVGILNIDKETGGSSCWCCLFAIPKANETKYMFVTFDRGMTSSIDGWTYGTTYIYESFEGNSGMEYPVKMIDGYDSPANVIEDYSPTQLHFKRVSQKTHYFCDWIDYEGFCPEFNVNRTNSKELILENATIEYNPDGKTITISSNSEGFANIAPYVPMSNCWMLRIFNINGVAEFVISNADYTQYRKVIFNISDGVCSIGTSDNFDGSAQEYDNELSFNFENDFVDVFIGINGFNSNNNFSIIIRQY